MRGGLIGARRRRRRITSSCSARSGLGYDRGNDRLLVQLEEMLESDLATSDDEEEEDEDEERGRGRERRGGRRTGRPRAHPLLRHAQPGRRVLRTRRPAGGGRTTDLHVVRPSHRPRRTHVPAHELRRRSRAGARATPTTRSPSRPSCRPTRCTASRRAPCRCSAGCPTPATARSSCAWTTVDGDRRRAVGPGDLQARARRAAALGLRAGPVPP